jgi:hypothetical protein
MKQIITFLIIAAAVFGIVWYYRKQQASKSKDSDPEAEDESAAGKPSSGSGGGTYKNETTSPEQAVRDITNTTPTQPLPRPSVRLRGHAVAVKTPRGSQSPARAERRQIQR